MRESDVVLNINMAVIWSSQGRRLNAKDNNSCTDIQCNITPSHVILLLYKHHLFIYNNK